MPRTRSAPNILLIMTDQHRADHLGCYGNGVLRTPHIDAIARRGVRAGRFYVANTTCMSNRATLMTGRMPSRHGVVHNGINLDRDHVTFVDLLKDAGYATALIGKSHLQAFGYDGAGRRTWTNAGTGTPPSPLLRDAVRATRSGPQYLNEWTPLWREGGRSAVDTPYYGFDHVELCTLHGDQVGGDYDAWLARRHADPASLRGPAHAISGPRHGTPQAWRTRMPEHLYPSAYIGERTCAWLEEHARQHATQPFFLQCSFPDPHHPYTPPGRFWDMYRPQDIPLPPTFFQQPRPDALERIHGRTRNGLSREGTAAFSVSPAECQEIIALTYGMISMIDEQVGRIDATLERLGLRGDTVVIFTSDHGDLMGDYGTMLKGPIHAQGVIRVPFIWREGQGKHDGRAGATLDIPAGTLDIARTILEKAGVAPYNGLQGLSLLPWLEGRQAPPPRRRGMVIESEQPRQTDPGLPRLRVRSLVTDRWRITLSNHAQAGELYDLREDPLETRNLWASADARTQRESLLLQLVQEMLDLSDESPLPAAVA